MDQYTKTSQYAMEIGNKSYSVYKIKDKEGSIYFSLDCGKYELIRSRSQDETTAFLNGILCLANDLGLKVK